MALFQSAWKWTKNCITLTQLARIVSINSYLRNGGGGRYRSSLPPSSNHFLIVRYLGDQFNQSRWLSTTVFLHSAKPMATTIECSSYLIERCGLAEPKPIFKTLIKHETCKTAKSEHQNLMGPATNRKYRAWNYRSPWLTADTGDRFLRQGPKRRPFSAVH